jgi:antiviral helicase SLH1
MWPFDHPLGQFSLAPELLYKVQENADDWLVDDLAEQSQADIAKLIHANERSASVVLNACRQLPRLSITPSAQPIAPDLLRIRLKIERKFDWADRVHGRAEPFWIWVADESEIEILQIINFRIQSSPRVVFREFIVPVDSMPAALRIQAVSDRWIGSEQTTELPLDTIEKPSDPPPPTPLLDLPLLSLDTAGDEPLQRFLGQRDLLDPMVTQTFHTLYHTRANSLVCAPFGRGLPILAELAIWSEPVIPFF